MSIIYIRYTAIAISQPKIVFDNNIYFEKGSFLIILSYKGRDLKLCTIFNR